MNPARRPTDIEAALLYDGELPVFDGDDVVDVLNRAFGDEIAFAFGTHMGSETFTVCGGPFIVMVSRNPNPLGLAGFAAALDAPVTAFLAPDARDAVARHRANVFVTVSVGAPGFTAALAESGLAELLDDVVPEPSLETFGMAQRVCRMIVAWLVGPHFERRAPSLVHWCQSNMLMVPVTYVQVIQRPEAALLVHPHLYSPPPPPGEKRRVGIVTFGAAHLLGREITVTPTTLPLDDVVDRLAQVVETLWKHYSIAMIADGDTIGDGETEERIRVRHLPPRPGHPKGLIGLTFEVGPDDRDGLPPMPDPFLDSGADEPVELDMDNPTDRLIAEALERRRREDEREPEIVGAEASEPTKKGFGRRGR